jgi:mono/diheme cytochrome c family protein
VRLGRVRLGLAVLAAGAIAAQAAEAQPLPSGPGLEVVEARCLSCHQADLIASQRLSEAGWDREVTKMVRWGAMVSDADRPRLVAYLARHFMPHRAAAAVESTASGPAVTLAAGERAYRAACTSCHQDDLVRPQRLTRAGWGREVDKMVRWGAKVDAADREALISYLLALASAEAAAPSREPARPDQQGTRFRARLSFVPIDVAMAPSVTGVGSATAELRGTTLTIEGTFEGLQGPATVARLHQSRRGVRGPARFDLTVTPATSGTVTGTVELTDAQVRDLAQGNLYIQLHSEKAPDGNLWGWLLPETRR